MAHCGFWCVLLKYFPFSTTYFQHNDNIHTLPAIRFARRQGCRLLDLVHKESMGHNSSAVRSGLTGRWFLQPILRISASKENVYDETIVCRERREFHTNSRRYAKHNSLTEVHLWVIFFPFPSPPATTTVVVLSATFFILGHHNVPVWFPCDQSILLRICDVRHQAIRDCFYVWPYFGLSSI